MPPVPNDSPPTIHHDPLSGRPVFIAPRRADRPSDLGGPTRNPCPFCAGNESLTAADLLRWPGQAEGTWKARIVPNRYPVVEPLMAAGGQGDPDSPTISPAHGLHEVVIESPDHVGSVRAVPAADWQQVWELCRQRLGQLAADGRFTWATLFKNGGPAAGASLEHVHSQLIALDRVPPTIEAKCRQLARTPNQFTRLIEQAETAGRMVSQHDGLVALVPPAPRQPFEVWLVPEKPAAFFHEATGPQVQAVAALTQGFATALDRLVPQASFNWWLHQFPFVDAAKLQPLADHWHWHLEILPRLAPLAGFELGTGCHISTIPPATAAQLLRETGCW